MQTKIVLAKGSRRIELEGTQEFVDSKLSELLYILDDETTDESDLAENGKQGEHTGGENLGSGMVSLKKFFELKAPKNTYQAIACVIFHAKKYKGIEEQSGTEIRNSLILGKFRPPAEMNQAMSDCRRKYGYVESGSKKGFWKLTHEGETTVEFDLPGSVN